MKKIVLCKERLRLLIIVAGLFLVLGISVLVLNAQSDRGAITGTVTDQTGAAMVGVSVVAVNTETAVTSKTTTGENGTYTINLLPTGTYNLSAEKPGFKRFVRNGTSLQIGQTTRIDIPMELGSMNETVEVQADVPALLPNTSDLGTVISRQQLEDLPLIGNAEARNPTFFMTLVPGVTGRGSAWGAHFSGGGTFDARYLSTTVSGSQSGSTEFHLDGSIIASAGEFSADPRNIGFPPEAVAGFNMITLNAPAEHGRTGGGIASFTLKSGTNQFHGSLYEYFRNDALDARGFFAPTTPTNRQNEFGLTVGGPIRKDKTFFFGWYGGFRMNRALANSAPAIVPTEAMKRGDFRDLLGAATGSDALGRAVLEGAIYDPLTTRKLNAGQVDPVTGLRTTEAATIRDPFPGNTIPSSRFDRVAKNILPLFPGPNRPGDFFNFESQAVDIRQVNGWGTKIDHTLTARHKLFGSFVSSGLNTPGVSSIPGPLSSAIPTADSIRILRLSEDFIVRPNLVNHVTFGFNRWRSGTNPSSDALGWPAKIGLTGVNENGVFPLLRVEGGLQDYGGTGLNHGAQNNFDVNQSLSWIKGSHTLKFGFEYLKMMSNQVSSQEDTGSFSFSSTGTALPGFSTGQWMASFLLGSVDFGQVRVYTSASYERSGYYAGYAQDDFKVSPKLTLNVGLRYDLYRPTVDKFNHLAWMDRTAPNPALGGFRGTMIFATPERRTGVDQFNKGFAPRFGLAFGLNDKTVVRTGYSLFWAAGGYVRASRGLYLQGYNSTNPRYSSFDGTSPAFVLQDGWPASKFLAPPFIGPDYGFNRGVNILDRDDAHPPYLQNWTLNIQRQLPGQILLDLAYVGNRGTRLQSRLVPTNQMDPRYLSLGNLLYRDIADPDVQALPIVQAMPIDPATNHHVPFARFETIADGQQTLGQALRPFPQYREEGNSQIRRLYEGTGFSNYHALQVKIDKRFSRGLSLLAAYTWSKTLTDAESQFSEFSGFTADPYNRKAEKSYSINDYPHNLVINYAYELPFGPSKKFAKAAGAMGKVVGGWKIAGVQQYQSGGPSMNYAGELTYINPLWPYEGANMFAPRPNIVPGVPQKSAALLSGDFDPNRDSMFNPAAFSEPAPFTFGNGPRTYGSVRRFAYLNEDVSLSKRTNVNERVSVEFRADFVNIFNRTVLGLGTGGDQYGVSLDRFIKGQSNSPREIQFGLKINY